jgi:Nuclease-related domain
LLKTESGTADTDGVSSEPHAAVREPLERGEAGASARRKYEKLHEARAQQARDKYGRLSGLYLAATDEPQSMRAWGLGANGEQRLGAYLDKIDDGSSVIVLHDRRIPGSSANIDHIAITRSGVYAVDAKNIKGKVQRIDRGGWLSTDRRLYVAGRDRTALVDGMTGQLSAIRSAIGRPLIEELELSVTGVLCFVEAEWPLFLARPLRLGSIWIEWSRSLAERLRSTGALSPEDVRRLAVHIGQALPSA